MRRLISILFLLISLSSFGQYEKLFSDKNIAPYNLILKDKFIWLDKEVVRDSLVYAELKPDSIRFRYFDGNYTDWYYVPELSGIRDTLQFHSDSLAIAFDSISQHNSRLIELEGLDTTGIYHINRPILDAITVGDTTRWGAATPLIKATLQDVLIGTDTNKVITPLVAAQRDSLINIPYSGAIENIYTDYNVTGDSIFANYFNILLMDNAHEADPLFQDWNRTDGINIETKQIWDLDEVLSFYAQITDITGGVLDADFTSVTINDESVVVNSDLTNYVEWPDTTTHIATKYDIENVEVDLSGYTQFTDLDTLSFLRSYTETDPVYSSSSWFNTTNNSGNWNTAYGWGDHSGVGYLTGETDPIFNAHLSSTITPADTSWWGTNYWDMTATGIHRNGNVAVGSYAPDYGVLRVTAAGGNDWINYNYHRSSAGNGIYVGLTTGYADERKLLSLNRGENATHEFYANGKVRFFNYGSGSTFTGTVENYLATDVDGNLIVASGTSGSGDDWGKQVVQTDATLTGDGTSANPLSVVSGGSAMWESSSGFINPINDENILIGGSAYPLVRFVSADFPTRHAQLYFDGSFLRGNYSDGSTLYDVISWGQLGLQTTGLLLSSSTNYNNLNGSIRYDGTDLLGRVGGVWKSLTASGGGTSIWSDGSLGYKADTKNLEIYNPTPTLYFNDSQYAQNYSFELLDNGLFVNAYDNDLGAYASSTPLKIRQLGIQPTGIYDKNNTRGTAGQVLSSTGSSIEWINSSAGGGGDVYKVGTPVNNQLGVWTGDGTIKGDADLTFDGTNLTVTGNVTSDQNRTQSTLVNPSTYDYTSGAKARINLTADVSDMTITNLPDGSEGSLEVYQDATGNRTFTIAGSTGYTTLKRVGPKTEINLAANSHTTIAYWRTGDILYYGFVDDQVPSSSGGDNWGSQVVVTDTTLTGSGTTASPLSVVSSGGMTDPMTTAGDLIYRNSSNITTRLPRGSNGQVLKATSTGIAWGTDGGSLWTDAGTHTYLSSTTDNLSIGSSSNNGFKLYVSGNGYFTTGLVSGNNIQGKSFSISEEQSTITGITGTEGGVFRVGSNNRPYFVSDYNDGNKVYDLTAGLGVGTSTTIIPENNLHTRITVSASTTITISNSTRLTPGMTGNITVVNTSPQTITFVWAGGTIYISPALNPTGAQVTTSGEGRDVYSWWYDGTEIFINGTKGYQTN